MTPEISVLIPASLSAILLAVLSLFLLILCSRPVKFLNQLPSPPKIPIFGIALQLNVSNEEMTQKGVIEWPRKYGPRFGTQIGPKCFFVSLKPTDLEKLLSSSVYIQKGSAYKLGENWLGEGLLTSSGAKWFHRRKLLTPSFHFKILDEFLEVFNSQSHEFVDILAEHGQDGKKVLEICQYVTRCTLDIICETAMGKKLNAQSYSDTPYVRAIYGVGTLLQYRFVRPWLHPNVIWRLTPSGYKEQKLLKVIHGFTDSVIQERKAYLQKEMAQQPRVDLEEEQEVFLSKNNRPAAFMDLLLRHQTEHPSQLSDQDIREETDTFMFEGHDTTAASLSWTIHLLGRHPECQEIVYQELESIFEGDMSRPVTSKDLSKMKYLEYCIKESLRLYPSVPIIGREVTQDLELEDGLTVPKGCAFPVHMYSLHRDPVYYPDPEAFIPERFLPENSVGRHPFAYLPFSAGPRNCIGQKFALMEEKVVLSYVLRKFRIESMDRPGDIVLMTELILRPRDGLRVTLHPRY